jgi:RHS repeat-associated protein
VQFVYDAGGDRVAKLGRGGEQLTIGQWFSLKGRKAATKHIFVGATRVASKLLPPPGWDAPVPETDPATIPGCTASDFQPRKCAVPPLIEPKVGRKLAGFTVKPATYYYHPDHLGSTSWVTDQNGKVHEHAEYFPYGEVWRDPRSDSESSPVQGQQFLFTGKELDEETGLYYFGARYYDPVRARWASADPALEGYLDGLHGFGGVHNARNLGLYGYAHHNPVRLVDPDGESATLIGALVGGAVSAGISAWRGEDARHILGAAAQGAIAGAALGSIIDTGGASLGVMIAAGATGNVAGGIVGRAISGDAQTGTAMAMDAATGAGGALLGAAVGKTLTVAGQRLLGPSRALPTLRPGPFAGDSVPATGPRVTAAQSRAVTKIGVCHTCGSTNPGRASGVFTGDHQPASSLIVRKAEQSLFPHCTNCSNVQGWHVRMQNMLWRSQQDVGRTVGAAATTSASTQATKQ